MNIEVEIKVKVDNLKEIRERVTKVGRLVKAIRQIDDYYIPCHRDFLAQKPQPTEWLRIRTNPDKVVFEYDKAINMETDGNYEHAEEYETEISNSEELKKILSFLDFKKVITVDKQREYWMCGDIEIALDTVVGLGDYVEAEAKGDFKNSEEAKQACLNFLKNIGIEDLKKLQIKKGYPVLLMENK